MVCDVLVGVCAEQLQEGELHAVRFVCELSVEIKIMLISDGNNGYYHYTQLCVF